MESIQRIDSQAVIAELEQLANELHQIGNSYGGDVKKRVTEILYSSAQSNPEMTSEAALFTVLKQQAAKAEFRKQYGDEIGEMVTAA